MRNFLRRLSIAKMFGGLVRPCSVHVYAKDKPAAVTAGEQTTPAAEVPEKRAEEKNENEEYLHSPMVQTLGKMLGMSTEKEATVFTVLNFVVLATAVGYGLLKMLPKTFRKRSSDIQKHLVDARTATE